MTDVKAKDEHGQGGPTERYLEVRTDACDIQMDESRVFEDRTTPRTTFHDSWHWSNR
jgi:hypothetical protein